ncbi:MAG: hypothetical protein KGQ59_08870, partial [Bdellovibrionales bacterium]|nr:hypothetical protein [Bdellovibrionales bacterium]
MNLPKKLKGFRWIVALSMPLIGAGFFISASLKEKKNHGRSPSSTLYSSSRASVPAYRRGEVIVKWRALSAITTNSLSGSVIERLRARGLIREQLRPAFKRPPMRMVRGFQKALPSDLNSVQILQLADSNTSMTEVLSELRKDPSIAYAEPNFLARAVATPNDPRFSNQWAHFNTDAEKGWDLEQGKAAAVIAVIDTGVDYQHEDLK